MISQFSEDQRQQIYRIWQGAFNMSLDRGDQYMAYNGWENVRALESNGEIASCLVICDFGQYFGGRSIRSAGIAAVGAALHHRSKGLARALLNEMLREQHERGVPLSTLYPSTRTLYRRAGYESAGAIHQTDVENRRIDLRTKDSDLIPISDSNLAVVEDMHARFAARHTGNLERTPGMWHRVRFDRQNNPNEGYVIEFASEPEGYFYFRRGESKTSSYSIEIWDVATLTQRAAARFLSFLAEQRAQSDLTSWWGGPAEGVLMLLNEQAYKVRLNDEWMLRIVDVKRALEGRGYPMHVRGTLHVEVGDDDVIPDNNGRFVVDAEDGRATMKDGGSGRLRISIRGLAPLFTGYYAPQVLRDAGLLEGDDESLDLASALFAGPTPWMRDKF